MKLRNETTSFSAEPAQQMDSFSIFKSPHVCCMSLDWMTKWEIVKKWWSTFMAVKLNTWLESAFYDIMLEKLLAFTSYTAMWLKDSGDRNRQMFRLIRKMNYFFSIAIIHSKDSSNGKPFLDTLACYLQRNFTCERWCSCDVVSGAMRSLLLHRISHHILSR